MFFADIFRIELNLTVNYGLRWEFSDAQHQRRRLSAERRFEWRRRRTIRSRRFGRRYESAAQASRTFSIDNDYVNPAPNIGLTWNPTARRRSAGKLLGHDKSVFSSAYRITYYDEGMNAISNLQCGNDGATQSATPAPRSLPTRARFTPSASRPRFTTSPPPSPSRCRSTTPSTAERRCQYINPNLRIPYVQSWNLRFQREIARGTVLDIRTSATSRRMSSITRT